MNLAKILFQTQLNVKGSNNKNTKKAFSDFDQLLMSALSKTADVLTLDKQAKQSPLNNSVKPKKMLSTEKKAKEPSTLPQISPLKTEVFTITFAPSLSHLNAKFSAPLQNNFHSPDDIYPQFRDRFTAIKDNNLKQNLAIISPFSSPQKEFSWNFSVSSRQVHLQQDFEKQSKKHTLTYFSKKTEHQSALLETVKKSDKLPDKKLEQFSYVSDLSSTKVFQPKDTVKKTPHFPQSEHFESSPVAKNDKKVEQFSTAVKDTVVVSSNTINVEQPFYPLSRIDSPINTQHINKHSFYNISKKETDRKLFFLYTDNYSKNISTGRLDKKAKITQEKETVLENIYSRVPEKFNQKESSIPTIMQHTHTYKANKQVPENMTHSAKDIQQHLTPQSINSGISSAKDTALKTDSNLAQKTEISGRFSVSNTKKSKKVKATEHQSHYIHNKDTEKESAKEKPVDNTELNVDEKLFQFSFVKEKREETKSTESGAKSISPDSRISSETLLKGGDSFSQTEDNFSGDVQYYKTDHTEEGEFAENSSRNITFSLKIGDIAFKARYNGYKLDLMILMNNYPAEIIKAMKTDIPHILEETGIQNYILRVKNKDKNYKVSSEYSNTNYKNSSLREVDVKV